MTDQRKMSPEDVERLLALRDSSGIEQPPAPELESQRAMPKGRAGMKGVVVYLTPVAKEALVRISERERRTLNELSLEAINMLFVSRGEKPIA
jgi:hypothetical protein